MLGYQVYGIDDVWRSLVAFNGSEAHVVIRDLRIPRAILAPVIGACLGLAGVLMQTVTRNRLASPDLLGLNAGAALAVVIANVLFGIDAIVGLSIAAAAGALLAAAAVYAISSAGGGMTPARTVLVGMTMAGLLISFVQMVLTTDEPTLHQLLFWLAGAFEGRPLALLSASGPLLVLGVGMAFVMARSLDAMHADDDTARGIGVPINLMRTGAFIAIAALTGGAVAIAGPVGFIGLVAPHTARLLVGVGHDHQMMVAGLVGALYATSADVAARFILFPSEAPVGAVTALIGSPVLLFLLRRQGI
jgi:iron complex transport system permease protein